MKKIFPHQTSSHAGSAAQPVSPARSGSRLKIKLSPLARLYWTLDAELTGDPNLANDVDRYGRFIHMHLVAEKKRDQLIRTLIIVDALILLLMFGKGFTIPSLNVSLKDIPAAREALTFLGSVTFQFLALAFVNWHGYSAIIDAINVHRAKLTGVDADYLSASDKFFEFTIKLYRTRMNIYGTDYIIPGLTYKAMAACVRLLLLFSVFSFMVLHLTVMAISAHETVMSDVGLIKYAYLIVVSFSNLGGLLVFATLGRRFTFFVPVSSPTVSG